MATRVATIFLQALILALLVQLSISSPYGPQNKRAKERAKHSFVHLLQEGVVRMLPADNLDISDVKATTFQRVLHFAKKHLLAITVLLLVICFIVIYFCSDAQKISKMTAFATPWNTSGVPKTSAEVPLLPVEKARENTRDQQQWELPGSLEKMISSRFSSTDGRTRDEQTVMPVPRSAQPVTMTRTEVRPVREKVQSEVEDPERTRETLELLGFTLPKNAKFYLPNYIDKGYEEWTTNADWPYQETAHQASPELHEVKDFAERSQRLH